MHCSTEAPFPVYGLAGMVKKPCGRAVRLRCVYTNITSFFMKRLKTALTVTVEAVCSCVVIEMVLWSLHC